MGMAFRVAGQISATEDEDVTAFVLAGVGVGVAFPLNGLLHAVKHMVNAKKKNTLLKKSILMKRIIARSPSLYICQCEHFFCNIPLHYTL